MMEKKTKGTMVAILALLFAIQFLSCIETAIKIRTTIKSI